MMFWFYRRYDRLQTPAALMSVTLLAFSWENIIYAQQMGSYAIGVFSAAALLYLLWKNFQIRQPRFSHMLGIVIGLAVLSYTQYQVLFFIPAFLAVLFLYYAIKNCRDLPMLLVRFTSAGLCYALLIFPLYFFFLLKKKETAGITWNVGPNQEFQFLLPQGPALEKLSYAASFFAKNSFLVLSNNFAFIPETHPLYRPFAFLFAAFVLFGIFSLVFSRSLRKKMLALFFFLAAATWACLVVKNKIALSPTRHSLILLPFMVMMFSEGWIRFVHFFKRNAQVFRSALTGGLWTSILIFFALSCVPVLKERRDPFHEGELRRLFEEYRPGGVIATDYTINLNLMHSIKSRFNYFESETMDTPLAAPDADLNTVAFISHRQPLDRETFNLMRFKVNLRQRMQGKNHFIAGELEDYKVIYSKAIKSDTEVEFSRRTRNGSNNLFLTILRKA